MEPCLWPMTRGRRQRDRPCARADRPAPNTGQIPDSPAGFLESWRGAIGRQIRHRQIQIRAPMVWLNVHLAALTFGVRDPPAVSPQPSPTTPGRTDASAVPPTGPGAFTSPGGFSPPGACSSVRVPASLSRVALGHSYHILARYGIPVSGSV
jgi:hypothetical protein